MKFTMNWLKRHLDTDATLEQICDTLTAIGLEVEGVEDRAKDFAPFKVALIEKAEQHPDADRLKVCTVKTENGDTVQVVCGAPNAKTGLKGIFAPDGSYIPGLDVTLKATEIRGVKSNGMMVSEKEMCLSDEHNGIIELPEDTPLGTPMAQIFGLDDPVIEINVTPNRADCAGVHGIARDLAAAGLGTLKTLNAPEHKTPLTNPVTIKIEDTDGCPHFMTRTIKNVQNGQSPKWMQDLLKSIGQRPISALVDITNFMTMDHARPLHVFDADKLSGNLAVRETKSGEKLNALDDKSYDIIDGAVGVYDDSGLISLGGIVGGTSTSVDENTTNIVIEAAYFNPMRIARTGRDLGITSDARYRFERGIDPAFTGAGMDIATALVLELCGTDTTEISTINADGTPPARAAQNPDTPIAPVAYTYDQVNHIVGIDIPQTKQDEILKSLGFTVSSGAITPPSWRGDIFGAADIVEEVIRIEGYDKIPSVSVRSSETITHNPETLLQSRARMARGTLAARGLHECVTWSFTGQNTAALFGNDNAALTLTNPISIDLSHMRPSILPNLIEAAARNGAKGYADTALFEIGPVFRTTAPDGQDTIAAGIRSGRDADRHWSDTNANRAVDVHDAKSDALAALEAIGAPAGNAQISRDAPEYYHSGRSGSLRLGKNVLAYFGELHPAVLADMDIKTPIVGFEVFLENAPAPRKKGTEKKLLKLADLQPITRDFAFVVESTVEATNITRAAIAADKNMIVNANVFDVYTGTGVEDGHKSVAINITIQPKDKSLTDKDIDAITTKVIENVVKKTGGTLRG